MIVYKTYRFKIKDPNPGKLERLRALARLFRKGLNYGLEMAKQIKPRTAFDLHKAVYARLRRFGLPSQMALSCRDKAFEAYRSHAQLKKKDSLWRRFPHVNHLAAIRFNMPRSCKLSYVAEKQQYWASVSTLDGRVHLRITGNRKALERVVHSQASHAEIVFKEDALYLHVAVPFEVEKPAVSELRTFIGVDLNVLGAVLFAQARDITGQVLGCFSIPAARFNWKREHFFEVRRRLQEATKPEKVKQLKNKESSYVTCFLQSATSSFIGWTKQFPDAFIGLEDLKNIRNKVHYSKRMNGKIHSWPFRSGRDMIEYKGRLEGMFVRALRSAFSSRYCSRCQSKNTRRSGALFVCLDCGYRLNAHLNGAGNMSQRAISYRQVAAGRAGRPPSVNPALKPSAVTELGNV